MKLFTLVLLLALAAGASAQTHIGVVKLDTVTFQTPDSLLSAGHIHRVSIRYDLRDNASGAFWTGSNAFELYSPDGADWRYLKGLDGPLVASLPPWVVVFRKHKFSTNDGVTYSSTAYSGADSAVFGGPSSRAAFALSTVDASGLGGYAGGIANDIALYLEFGTRHEDVGRTICLDSLLGRGTVAWQWSAPLVGDDYPQWDNGHGVSGPRCWEIGSCCQDHTGDANNSGDDRPTIGDVMAIIDYLFITRKTPPVCLAEADVNHSGGASPTTNDITIGDVTMLVDFLFITRPDIGFLPGCM